MYNCVPDWESNQNHDCDRRTSSHENQEILEPWFGLDLSVPRFHWMDLGYL